MFLFPLFPSYFSDSTMDFTQLKTDDAIDKKCEIQPGSNLHLCWKLPFTVSFQIQLTHRLKPYATSSSFGVYIIIIIMISICIAPFARGYKVVLPIITVSGEFHITSPMKHMQDPLTWNILFHFTYGCYWPSAHLISTWIGIFPMTNASPMCSGQQSN